MTDLHHGTLLAGHYVTTHPDTYTSPAVRSAGRGPVEWCTLRMCKNCVHNPFIGA
jgi:hypothetical protein